MIWGIKRLAGKTIGLGKHANKFYETLTGDFRKRVYDNPWLRRKYIKNNKSWGLCLFLHSLSVFPYESSKEAFAH